RAAQLTQTWFRNNWWRSLQSLWEARRRFRGFGSDLTLQLAIRRLPTPRVGAPQRKGEKTEAHRGSHPPRIQGSGRMGLHGTAQEETVRETQGCRQTPQSL